MVRLKSMAFFTIKFLFFFYIFLVGFLYFFQNGLIFKGAYSKLKFDNVLNLEKIPLRTTDGVNTYAYRYKSKEGNKKAVIIFHGNNDLAGNAVNRHIEHGFKDTDFDLIAVEYRGYDEIKSQRPSEKSIKLDAEAIIPVLKDYEKIVYKAHSIGSFPAIHLASKVNPDGLILEAPLYNMITPARRTAFFVPNFLLINILKAKFKNNEQVKGLDLNKVLVLHSKDDKVIPFNEGKALFDLINAKSKAFKEYEDFGHNDIVKFDFTDTKEFLKGI